MALKISLTYVMLINNAYVELYHTKENKKKQS